MEGFLHILSTTGNLKFINVEKIKKVINNYKSVDHTFKIINNDYTFGVYYTNEYTDYPYSTDLNSLFCPVGQFAISKSSIQKAINTYSTDDFKEYFSKLSGAYSISNVNLIKNDIDVYTHVIRAESVYLYKDENLMVVGSDPLLVSIFSNEKLTPIFDASNFVSYLEQGYFADENTPFKNVNCLPANSHIKINSRGIQITEIDNTYEIAFTFPESEELFEEITTSFVNSFNVVESKGNVITSDLTGGKDSRVVLLALLENGFNVNTRTTGFKDHPDVIIAKELAELLNVPHKVNQRKVNSSNQITIDLTKRLETITNASSGMLSAYDSVVTRTHFDDHKNFNGVGASVITGGFNKFNKNIKSTVKEAFKNSVYKFNDYYLVQNNKYDKHLDQFSQKSDDLDELLHLFFLLYRSGRWTSDSRVPKSYATNSYSPFLDNALTKSTMKLNMASLRSEIIHYKLIEKLNSRILNIPFFKYRFAFENHGPSLSKDYNNWLQREPIYSTSKLGSYNWRAFGNNDATLINAFKEIILSNHNNPVFDIVDYNKVENLLSNKMTNRTNKFIWSLASMIYFINDINKNNANNDLKIKIDTPATSIHKEKIPKQLIDLTDKFESLNKKIDYNKRNFNITNFNANPYLKTFTGGFQNVPTNINLKDVKSLFVKSSVTLTNISKEVKMMVIFYNNDKRFKTVIIEPFINVDNEIIFSKSIKVPNLSEYFRVAIHFKSLEEGTKGRLNYSLAELNF